MKNLSLFHLQYFFFPLITHCPKVWYFLLAWWLFSSRRPWSSLSFPRLLSVVIVEQQEDVGAWLACGSESGEVLECCAGIWWGPIHTVETDMTKTASWHGEGHHRSRQSGSPVWVFLSLLTGQLISSWGPLAVSYCFSEDTCPIVIHTLIQGLSS